MSANEAIMLAREFRLRSGEMRRERDAALKELNARQKTEVAEMFKRHRAEDRELKERYRSQLAAFDASNQAEIEAAKAR